MTAFAFNLVRLNQAATYLTGVSAPNYDRRETERPLVTDGTLHQTGAAVIRTAPTASWTSIAGKALFALYGSSQQVPFIALDGTNGLELIGPKINTAAPGYDGTAVHARRQFKNGDLYLRRLSWSPGDVLRAESEAFALSTDGTADPVVSDTIAAPNIPVNTEQLVLSSAVFNALSLTRLTSLDVAITHQGENNDDELCYTTGKPHPILGKRIGTGGASEIICTAETLDLTSAISNGTVTLTFTVLNNNGAGLGSTGAIATLANCLIRERTIKGEDGRPAKRQITARATWDGTTKPLTLTTF